MKIALLGPTYPFRGGIAHHTTLLYRHLAQRHEVQFFTFSRQYPQWLFPGKSDRDPSQVPLRADNVHALLDSLNPFSWFRTARAIRRTGAEVLIIPWWVAFWAPPFWVISRWVGRGGRTRILFLCHNVVAHEGKWLSRRLTTTVLRRGDGIVVQSDEDQRRLRQLLPQVRICKGFHPSYEVFNRGRQDPQALARRLGIQGKVMLFFGFVREYKGLSYLLEALPAILDQVDVTLLIVGEFWRDKDRYIQRIEALGLQEKVVIVDEYVPNEALDDYFALANLVVQPYLSATGSGVVQTAFGFDKPVVATAVGALSEVVRDGQTGYLVPPASSPALAQAIVNYFSLDKEADFSRNIAADKARFSWQGLVDIMEQCVGAEARG